MNPVAAVAHRKLTIALNDMSYTCVNETWNNRKPKIHYSIHITYPGSRRTIRLIITDDHIKLRPHYYIGDDVSIPLADPDCIQKVLTRIANSGRPHYPLSPGASRT